MRVLVAAAILGLLWASARAQPAPPEAVPSRGGDAPITRQQFVDRASRLAGQRFDAIDANHTGTITRAQLKAWRATHNGQSGRRPAPEPDVAQ